MFFTNLSLQEGLCIIAIIDQEAEKNSVSMTNALSDKIAILTFFDGSGRIAEIRQYYKGKQGDVYYKDCSASLNILLEDRPEDYRAAVISRLLNLIKNPLTTNGWIFIAKLFSK